LHRFLWAFDISLPKDESGKFVPLPDPNAFTATNVSRPVGFKFELTARNSATAVIKHEWVSAERELLAWE
jgi:hypothetical protein